MTMTKRDLVIRVSKETKINQVDVKRVLESILKALTEELAAGNTIEFRNFGVFEVLTRKARVGRNPNAPSKEVQIPERAVVKFRAGKEMKKLIAMLDPKKLSGDADSED
jgi:DNA-binding protein HU-beta/integration host factor subunit alpha